MTTMKHALAQWLNQVHHRPPKPMNPNLFDLGRRPLRHSYSSISKYKECPRAYAYNYIEGRHVEPSGAMARGTRFHAKAEDFMLKADAPVPYELIRIGIMLTQLKQAGGIAEQTWMVDKDWRYTEDPTRAKVKAVVDVHYVAEQVLHVYDYKTGKQYPTHLDQLELYSVLGLAKYPEVSLVKNGAIYIDQGTKGSLGSLIRPMLPKVIAKWQGQIDTMEADCTFEPTPGWACGRCNYSRFNGGPCREAQRPEETNHEPLPDSAKEF